VGRREKDTRSLLIKGRKDLEKTGIRRSNSFYLTEVYFNLLTQLF